ncbi:MAG: glycosylase [Planctomycetota bacterium]
MPNTLPRLETRCLLRPADLPPSREGFEVVGTFNPAAVQLDDGSVVMLVRVAERPTETRAGFVASPRYDERGEIVIDWIDETLVTTDDPRMAAFTATGFKRLTFINHLRVVRLADDGVTIREVGPIVDYHADHAAFGLEDPRITKISDTFYITAVGASHHGVCTVLLSTTDFENYDDLGITFCRENKDIVLFPEKINGRYAAVHRPTGKFEVMQPEMWLAYSPDLKYWGDHQPLWGSDDSTAEIHPSGGGGWDDGRVGGGVPPIRTDKGWLKIYHASCKPGPGEPIGVYAAGALLLDLEDPSKILAASPDAFMKPEQDFEKIGFVKAVVFPTGYAIRGDNILLYYGAADTNVGVVRYQLQDLIDSLTPIKP